MQNKIKIFLLIFTLVNYYGSLLSQELSESWKLIKSDDISDILIEPSNIMEYGNEISVWAIEKLREPINSEKDEKITSIKTHYLFNKMKKKYVEIGVLYYDEKGGIINRSSKSSFKAGPSAFMTPISYNPNSEIIYNEVISYLITGNISSTKHNSNNDNDNEKLATAKNSESIKDQVENKDILNKEKSKTPQPLFIEKKSESRNALITIEDKAEENSSQIDLTEESWNNIPKIYERVGIIDKPSINSSSAIKELDKIEIDDSIYIEYENKEEYNLSNEKELNNAIFTDGYLYCFQVSSWKTKSYADRELNKLLAKGYNAFLVSVKPKHKNSIWHRVRVGYFDSLQKAQSIQRKIKQK